MSNAPATAVSLSPAQAAWATFCLRVHANQPRDLRALNSPAALTLGTAKITAAQNLFIVTWMNGGSFLRNEPRAFRSESGAREFCRERGLRVV